MWIYLSKTCEIYQGAQCWECAAAQQGSQLPSLLGSQAFG